LIDGIMFEYETSWTGSKSNLFNLLLNLGKVRFWKILIFTSRYFLCYRRYSFCWRCC